MKNSYCFFRNEECEYFPCHKVEHSDNFNCLFCYCPLYLKVECGGNYTYTASGIKDCSQCMIPHIPENYNYILSKLFEK